MHRKPAVLFLFILAALAGSRLSAQEADVLLYKGSTQPLYDEEQSASWWLNTSEVDPINESLSLFTEKDPKPASTGQIWKELANPFDLKLRDIIPPGQKTIWLKKYIQFSELPKKNVSLRLGRIFDRERVYFNGHLIGSTGHWSESQSLYYGKERIYSIPTRYIRPRATNVLLIHIRSEMGSHLGLERSRLAIGPDDELRAAVEKTWYSGVAIACLFFFMAAFWISRSIWLQHNRSFLWAGLSFGLLGGLLLLSTPLIYTGGSVSFWIHLQLLLWSVVPLIIHLYWRHQMPVDELPGLWQILIWLALLCLILLSVLSLSGVDLVLWRRLFNVFGITALFILASHVVYGAAREIVGPLRGAAAGIFQIIAVVILIALFFPLQDFPPGPDSVSSAFNSALLFLVAQNLVLFIAYNGNLKERDQYLRAMALGTMANEVSEAAELLIRPGQQTEERFPDPLLLFHDYRHFITGDIRLTFTRVRLDNLVNKCVDRFSADTGHDIEVQSYYHGSLYLDRDRFSNIIWTVLAISASTLEGKSDRSDNTIRIKIVQVKGENRVVLSFSSQGRPIELLQNQRIFEPFFENRSMFIETLWSKIQNSVRPPGQRKTYGPYGLVTARKIIEYHGGRISLSNRPGESNTFEIRLPT